MIFFLYLLIFIVHSPECSNMDMAVHIRNKEIRPIIIYQRHSLIQLQFFFSLKRNLLRHIQNEVQVLVKRSNQIFEDRLPLDIRLISKCYLELQTTIDNQNDFFKCDN